MLEDNEEIVVHTFNAGTSRDHVLGAPVSGSGKRLGNSDTHCYCGTWSDNSPGDQAKSVTSVRVEAWRTRQTSPLIQLSAEYPDTDEEWQHDQSYYRLATR